MLIYGVVNILVTRQKAVQVCLSTEKQSGRTDNLPLMLSISIALGCFFLVLLLYFPLVQLFHSQSST